MPEVLDNALLVVPQNKVYSGFQGLVQTEPLGIEYVAGAISDLVQNVQISDERVRPGGWREKARQTPPSFIGVGCQYTADVPSAKRTIREIREAVGPDVPIVVGGHHISLRPEDLQMPEVTAIVVGRGEEIIEQAVEAWAQKKSLAQVPGLIYQNADGKFDSNVVDEGISSEVTFNSEEMDKRPEPRRDLVEEFRDEYYFLHYPRVYSVEGARGCAYRCSFCSVWKNDKGKYQTQTPEKIVEQISKLPDTSYINFVDDLAFQDIEGAEVLADGLMGMGRRFWAQVRADNVTKLKDQALSRGLYTLAQFQEADQHRRVFKKLADAGLDMVLIGLESFRPEELKRVNKGSTVDQNIHTIDFLHDIGVKIWGAQIVFPWWTEKDFDDAIEVNQRLGIDVPQFTILTPLPGTDDYFKAVEEGTLLTEDPESYDFFHSPFKTALPLTQFYSEIARLYKNTGTLADQVLPQYTDVHQVMKGRAARTLFADLRAHRTTKASYKGFVERFGVLRNEQVHLARLALNSAVQAVGGELSALRDQLGEKFDDIAVLRDKLGSAAAEKLGLGDILPSEGSAS